jgi:hypothetical protein
VNSEPEGFIAQLRSLFSTLFPKGKAPLDDEVQYLIDIVANAARKSLPFGNTFISFHLQFDCIFLVWSSL